MSASVIWFVRRPGARDTAVTPQRAFPPGSRKERNARTYSTHSVRDEDPAELSRRYRERAPRPARRLGRPEGLARDRPPREDPGPVAGSPWLRRSQVHATACRGSRVHATLSPVTAARAVTVATRGLSAMAVGVALWGGPHASAGRARLRPRWRIRQWALTSERACLEGRHGPGGGEPARGWASRPLSGSFLWAPAPAICSGRSSPSVPTPVRLASPASIQK